MTTLEIGGKVRKLCFSKMGFLDYLKESTDIDPLANGTEPEYSPNTMIWAGLMCQCLVEGVDPDFTKADIDRWIKLVEITDFRKVMEAATEAITGKAVEAGEALALQSAGTN